jgi:DNA-binding transcriptional MerR regulator
MPTDDLLVTPSEAVEVLRQLEPRAVEARETDITKLTPARLRYLESYGVVPTVRGSGVKGIGGSRLYGVADIAMLRIWVRLSEMMPTAARFTFAYLGDEIRQALASRRALVLVVRGKRAELLTPRQAERVDAAVEIPLLEAVDGVAKAIAALRADRPELWAGREWLTPREARQELALV